MSWPEVIVALAKALAAAADAYRQHAKEVEQARREVAAQAAGDLAAVEGPPRAG